MPTTTQKPAANLDNISTDVLRNILSYLKPEDFAHLEVNRSLWKNVNSTVLDKLWQPFLDRLNAIDEHFGEASLPLSELCIKDQFIAKLKEINSSQLTEVEHFIAVTIRKKHLFPRKVSRSLLAMNEPSAKLEILEQRHHFLNELNVRIIRKEIKQNSTELDITRRNLTRFPNELFKDPSLQDYWKNLKKLYCGKNTLRTLPSLLEKCIALEKLVCNNNQLHTVPDSIGNCSAFKHIICDGNQLQTAPIKLLKPT